MSKELDEIFQRIAERFETPIRIGSRCEANVYYRIEDLSSDDLDEAADFLGERIVEVCQPQLPAMVVHLPTSFTDLPDLLASQLAPGGEKLEVINSSRLDAGNGIGKRLQKSNVILVNDVTTTARSCLEVHTKLTMMGATVVAWIALIDRTFGPGPVPVIAAFTGEPVRLLEELG